MLRDLWNDWLMLSLCFAVVAILVGCVGLVWWDEKQWHEFKDAHACHVVGKTSGSVNPMVAPIIGGNGGLAVGISYTTGQTGWQCDDGVTYWR